MSLIDLTPRSLVDALRGRCPLARAELERRLAGPVEQLCRCYSARHPDLVVSDELIARLLRWIEAYLIRIPAATVSRWDENPWGQTAESGRPSDPNEMRDGQTGKSAATTLSSHPWRLFCLHALAAVTRLMLWEPPQAEQFPDGRTKIRPARTPAGVYILDETDFPRTTGLLDAVDEVHSKDGQKCPSYKKTTLPDSLRELVRSSGYDVDLYFQSRDAVGGDWVMIGPGPEHGFWAIVADFSGKSWTAYVLKQCVCLAWNSPLGRRIEAPSALLQKLHAALWDKLPEGTFVELMAGQFQPDGLTEIASAGMGHVLALDAATGEVSAELLSAPLMGIDVGKFAVRQVWQTVFSAADEVLLSTDGLYDQPLPVGRLGASLVAEVNSGRPVSDLHDCVVKLVARALETQRQHDDLTLLTVTRLKGHH